MNDAVTQLHISVIIWIYRIYSININHFLLRLMENVTWKFVYGTKTLARTGVSCRACWRLHNDRRQSCHSLACITRCSLMELTLRFFLLIWDVQITVGPESSTIFLAVWLFVREMGRNWNGLFSMVRSVKWFCP